ncbi:MAG TPA: TadE/TadG family type IV pilus assembly protein [Beijerinckiaceae bacterium]
MPDQRPAPDRPVPRLPRLVGRFRRDKRGATAVEFSLIGLPFFGLLFAIMETALVFWSGQVLEVAVADASRALYTGTFQNDANNASNAATKFKENICTKAGALIPNCTTTGLYVDVRVLPKFGASSSIPPVLVNKEINTAAFGYTKPEARQVVLVRAAAVLPVYASQLTPGLANLSSGRRLVLATSAFMTEPFATN